MKKSLLPELLGLCGLLLCCESFGQYAIPPQTRSQIAMESLSGSSMTNLDNVTYGLPAPPGQVLGDVYIDPVWNIGNIMLQSGVVLERYNVRYDLKSQMLEIQTAKQVKLLDYKMIKTVIWKDDITTRLFVSAASYKFENTALVGILEVLSDGNKPLLRRTTMHVKQPDYVPALDVGSRDAKIYKKTALYYSVGSDLHEVKGKKAVLQALGDKATEMESFIETNDLGTKSERDLVRIFDYYNSLFVPAEK
jgi:hypothetical protein